MRFLGTFSLEVDGEDRAAGIPARGQILLARLATDPASTQARKQLAFLLWPDSTEGQARTNLRNVLHHLRRAAPDLVDASPGHLRWGGSGCVADVIELVAALDRSSVAAPSSPEHLDALRAAVSLYRGDLLPDLEDDWLDHERQRLRDLHLGARRTLTTVLSPIDPAGAVTAGRELVRADPLNEEHHRLLMGAHAAAGDRAGAVRAYHECVEVLGEELGVQPSTATVEAFRGLVGTPAGPEPVRAPMPPTVAGSGIPLVGRAFELDHLMRRWSDARSGRAQLVLVSGEAGIGKTRLVDALCGEVARQGAVIARGRSYATEGEIGYGVIAEWLRTPAIATAVLQLSPADREELARLVPELAAGALPVGPADEGARLRLFEAAARAIAAVDRPMLLVADDVHWCDTASMQLLHYVLRSAAAPILVAATARPEALDDDHVVASVVRGLQVLDRATTVPLSRLDARQTRDLAVALSSEGLDDRAVRDLFAETEGNPLFVVEAMRAGWRPGDSAVDLSPKLHAVIGTRLAQLSAGARELLGVAATVGRAFDTDIVGRASGLDDGDLVQGLDELWRHGVIEGHTPSAYDFTHGKIRDAAYAGLSPTTRARNHQRIADALLATAGDEAATSGLVATHLDQAGRVDDAVTWYHRAAAHSLSLGAHAEALHLLDRSADLVASLSGPSALRAELALLELLPAVLNLTDGLATERLASVHERAAIVTAQLGVDIPAPLLRSTVMWRLCRDQFDEAAAAAGRLREVGTAGGDEGLELESTYLLGVIAFWSGSLARASDHFETVIERFEPGEHLDHLVRFGHNPRPVCLGRLANTLWFQGRIGDAVEARERALQMVADQDDFLSSEVVHLFSAVLSLDLEDPASFRRCAGHFGDGRDRTGVHRIVSEAITGLVDVLDGRADQGIHKIRTSFERCGHGNPAPSLRPMLARLLVTAHAAAGDPRGGLAAADLGLSLTGTRLWEPEVRRLRARFLAMLGHGPSDVEGELSRAISAASALAAPGAVAKVEATRQELLAS